MLVYRHSCGRAKWKASNLNVVLFVLFCRNKTQPPINFYITQIKGPIIRTSGNGLLEVFCACTDLEVGRGFGLRLALCVLFVRPLSRLDTAMATEATAQAITTQPTSVSRRKDVEAFVRDLDPLQVQGKRI